jgi:polyisoprenoid-binding protein YceI
MKKTIILSTLAIGLFACGSSNQNEVKEEAINEVVATETAPTSYAIDVEKSVVSWKGSMIGVYAHEGDLKLTEGSLTTEDGAITAGEFTVDMNTMITTDDDALYEMAPREKLIGHLKAPDFFDTEQFPTGNFKIKSVEGDVITGDLTLKGVTKEATINAVTTTETDGNISATGTLVFNRQDYGITYKNTMNDMVLSDDIELTISIEGAVK